jgi:anti-sigma factor RsiW
MNCSTVRDKLDDYIDWLLPEQEQLDIDAHLSACALCRDEERRQRSLIESARALPKELPPERDLWPELAARLEERSAWWRRAFPGLRPAATAPGRRWAFAAGFAAILVVVAVMTVLLLRERTGPVKRRAGADRREVMRAGAPPEDFALAEAEYAEAAERLLSALKEREPSLSPDSVATIEENVRTIRSALAEIKGAMEKHPGNRDLNALLMATYRKEVDLLQQAARLPDSPQE